MNTELIWYSKVIPCKVCGGGKKAPRLGCWLCSGNGY